MLITTILSEPNAIWVLLGVMALATATASAGTFAWLNNRSLIGDMLAHCTLPGITVAFLISQSRSPLILLPIALCSALLGNFLLNWLINKVRISPDSALAIVLSGFFAIGAMILSIIQKSPIAGKAGIDTILFGQAAALDDLDLIILVVIATVITVIIAVTLKKLRMACFDITYARLISKNPQSYQRLMSLMIVSCVVLGLQIVGVVLMSALLIFPAIIARQWSSHLSKLLVVGAIVAVISSIGGVLVSYIYVDMPTGPWIVVFLAIFVVLSIIFSPRSGILLKKVKRFNNQIRIDGENVIRTWYLLHKKFDEKKSFTFSDSLKVRPNFQKNLVRGMKFAIKKNYLQEKNEGLALTPEGKKLSLLLTRHHRLWENYLLQNKNLPDDAVHQSAEYAEHFIDSELAESIDVSLGCPKTDPHGNKIPSSNDLK